MKLQGVFPSIATPFDHEGNLYKAKVQHNVEKWNRTTLSGYLVCGSTGESNLLAADEKLRLWEWVAQWAAPEKSLFAGTGVESVRETVHLTGCAAELGYKAVVVQTPRCDEARGSRVEAQMLYFRSIADRCRLPILLHDGPPAPETRLPVEKVARLSEHPNIIGIQEGSGDLQRVMRLVQDVQSGFQVLAGSAATLWTCLQAGATGAVLDFANAAPYACITIWEAFRTREAEAAEDWQRRILNAARLVTTKYGVAGLKAAMDLNGYYGGPPRLPLAVPSPEARREIETAFAGING